MGFFIAVIFASLFHKSSLVIAPLGIIALPLRKLVSSFVIPIILTIAVIGLSLDILTGMVSIYVSDNIRSSQHASGGLIGLFFV